VTHQERVSLQDRVDRLGLTKDWRTVVAWAEQSKKVEALERIVATLEGTRSAQFEDYTERAFIVKIAGRSRSETKYTPAEPGAVAEAKELCAALVTAIDRTGVLLMVPTELERTRRWDGKKYAEMAKRAFWRYDDRLARAGRHLLAARRILAEPPADLPDHIKDALASRKSGRPRQAFNRAAVERALTKQLKDIAPPGETTAGVERLATKLLTKLQP
jgi:hypothetical protein